MIRLANEKELKIVWLKQIHLTNKLEALELKLELLGSGSFLNKNSKERKRLILDMNLVKSELEGWNILENYFISGHISIEDIKTVDRTIKVRNLSTIEADEEELAMFNQHYRKLLEILEKYEEKTEDLHISLRLLGDLDNLTLTKEELEAILEALDMISTQIEDVTLTSTEAAYQRTKVNPNTK